jgi:serine/threonine protein kinase
MRPIEPAAESAESLARSAFDATATTVELKTYVAASRPATAAPAVAAHAPIAPGFVLRDRYVIHERLGTGGRGTVFRARDRYRASLPDAQQYVALKVLHSGPDDSDDTINELRRELHCAQLLSHRNIVNVFEMDRDADVVFFTMELLDGALLSDVLERLRPHAMQRAQAWQIIKQLGAGLDHAHERGVVHGDLKPDNLLITGDGELRILDFGSARATAGVRPEAGASHSAIRRATPAYASCELLEGRAADPRDDLYAVACICYELLTGEHPFARRVATQARDYGVKAVRPQGLSARQWRTLQSGLSWHRAGRSLGVHAWTRRLAQDIRDKPSLTPLRELSAAGVAQPRTLPRAAMAGVAALLLGVAGLAQLRGPAAGNSPTENPLPASSSAKADTLNAAVTPAEPSPVAPSPGASPPGAPVEAAEPALQPRPPVPSTTPDIAVDGYKVSAGDHFVEVRVRRNQLQKNASFTWWTESASARRDVDYVHQAKAIQTFPHDRNSTRFYVKLLPDAGRAQRDFFYVAIAQMGRHAVADKVTRVQIWLPSQHSPLQARR